MVGLAQPAVRENPPGQHPVAQEPHAAVPAERHEGALGAAVEERVLDLVAGDGEPRVQQLLEVQQL